MHRIHPLLILFTSVSWSFALTGPQASGGSTPVRAGQVRVELISAATTSSFEGAVALLARVRFAPEFTPLDRWNPPAATCSIPKTGEIEFPPLEEGLYRLHLLDALGMQILDEAGPVWVSVVPGCTSTYRVESKRLDWVEGVILEDSIGGPVAGATLRVDPRFAVRGAPQLQVTTDEEGRYRVSTARSEIIAVHAPDYRTMVMRLGTDPVSGPLRMRPMLKRRSVVVDPGTPYLAAGSVEPRLALASQLTEPRAVRSMVAGSGDPGGTYSFKNVLYGYGVLYWPMRHGTPLFGQGKTRLVKEFLMKRGGGSQTLVLPAVEMNSVRLPILPPIAGRVHFRCALSLDRHTAIVDQGIWLEESGLEMFTLPGPREGATPRGLTLFTRPSSLEARDQVWLEWRGGSTGPITEQSLGAIEAAQALTSDEELSLVFEGDWLSHGVIRPTSEGLASLPRIGAGTLYGSSPAVRGDVVRAEIGTDSGSQVAFTLDAPSGPCSLNLRFLDGKDPVRWLAVHVVPAGLTVSGEILDLLGETPLVTDASGTVHLRNFVAGEYEVRVDLDRSANASAVQSLPSRTLHLRKEDQGLIDWQFGAVVPREGR